MTRYSSVLPVALLLTITGCDGGVELAQVPAESAQVFCARADECLGSFAGAFGAGASCESNIEGRVANTSLVQWQAAIDRGTATYDSAAASRCLQANEMLGCDLQNAPTPAACAEVLVGAIAAGAPCSITEECAGDAYCDGAACPGSPGTCTPRLAAGADCTEPQQCATGLSCVGGSCGIPSNLPGAACEGMGDCGSLDQVCSDGSCVLRSSVETAGQGESCALFGGPIVLCRDGVSCALTGIGATGAVFECAPAVASGATCSFAVPSVCPSGEYCAGVDPAMGALEGTCTPKPAAGAACGSSTLGDVCADGLVCEGGELCVAPQPNGAACSSAQACFSGLCEEGLCVAPQLCAI